MRTSTQRICRYCKDTIDDPKCPVCGKIETCLECHAEIVHGTVKNQNIQMSKGADGRLNDVDHDPDAYAPSWMAGN